MSKRYSIAGVSVHKGRWCVRYANSAGRARTLERDGDLHVELFDFEEALAKEDLVDRMLDADFVFEGGEQAKAAVVAEARSLGFML